MLHYHGTPITPDSELEKLAGKLFCVSFAGQQNAATCLRIGQAVMWDNGAFTFHSHGDRPDWDAFYRWVEPRLAPPHWAVVPDVIDGDPDDNLRLIREWPHRKDLAAVVWHLAEPFDHLERLLDLGFGKLCFGSSGAYWQIGSEAWERRVDMAFNLIAQHGPLPWVHMLRGLALCGDRWPFASADSTNVARNYKRTGVCPERMARRIDAVQNPIAWASRAPQLELLDAC